MDNKEPGQIDKTLEDNICKNDLINENDITSATELDPFKVQISQNNITNSKISEQKPTNIKPKKNNRFVVLIIATVLMVLGAGGASAYYLYINNSKDNSASVNEDNLDSNSDISNMKELVINPNDNIYFYEDGNLKGVNLSTKEAKLIDSDILSGSGGMGIGGDTPLNSPNLQSVAYIKNNSVWTYDGSKAYQISQPDIGNKLADAWLLAWSPDSRYLAYYIAPVTCCEIPSGKELSDESLTGAYIYSTIDNKSTKLPTSLEYIYGWLPESNKLLYQENTSEPGEYNGSNLWSYDITDNSSAIISKELLVSVNSINFSSDGTKMMYETGNKIVMADINNTNQKVLLSGSFGAYGSIGFIKNSNSDYLYLVDENRLNNVNDNSSTDEVAKYFISSLNDRKMYEISSIAGFYDENNIIAILETESGKILSLYNIITGKYVDIYTSDGTTNQQIEFMIENES